MATRGQGATFVPATVVQQHYHISTKSLRRWADEGTLRSVRFKGPEGKRLYDLPHLASLLGDVQAPVPRRRIVYARVSSAHQSEDLERQCTDLQAAYPQHELIKDVGSGLNFKRRGFTTLLDGVLSGMVAEVVVMHKDRLCRFGTELMDAIFAKFGTRFVVHGANTDASKTQELADDLLAITTVFVARHNGQRAAKNRRSRKQKCSDRNAQNSSLSNPGATKGAQGVDGGVQMDVQSDN